MWWLGAVLLRTERAGESVELLRAALLISGRCGVCARVRPFHARVLRPKCGQDLVGDVALYAGWLGRGLQTFSDKA